MRNAHAAEQGNFFELERMLIRLEKGMLGTGSMGMNTVLGSLFIDSALCVPSMDSFGSHPL